MSKPDAHSEVAPGCELSRRGDSNESNLMTLSQRSGLTFVAEENNDSQLQQPLRSKRQQRIAAIGGPAGADGTAKGSVRTRNGSLEYMDKKASKGQAASWKPAVYHDQIRAELIREMNDRGSYDHPREHGLGPNDVTAFHPDHKAWGKEREARPKILFQIHPEAPAAPAEGNNHGNLVVKRQVPPCTYQGRVVLDGDNHPVKSFPEIPLTCSSEMEGWEMEAIRRTNRAISDKDFRARMPQSRVVRSKDNKVLEERPQYSLSAIGMRQTRFRHSKGLLSWEARAGSENISSHILKRLPQECIAANSTESYRDLTPQELSGLGSENKGKFSYRKRPKSHALSATGNNNRKTSSEALTLAEGSGKIETRQREAVQTGPTEGRVNSDRTLLPVESDTAQDRTQVRVSRKRKASESLDDDEPDSARPSRSKKVRQEQALNVESAGDYGGEIPTFNQSYTIASDESQGPYYSHRMSPQFSSSASSNNQESVSGSPANPPDVPDEWNTPDDDDYYDFDMDFDDIPIDPALLPDRFRY